MKNEFECLTEAIKQELEAVRLAEESAEALNSNQADIYTSRVGAAHDRDSILDSIIGESNKEKKLKAVDPSAAKEPEFKEVPDVEELVKS